MGRGPEQTTFQRRYTDGQWTQEKMFSITNHQGKMHIKTTVRYHFTPIRMAIIKKVRNNECWRGCGEKGTLKHCWWDCKLEQPLWKTAWRLPPKLRLELPYDPSYSTSGYLAKEHKKTL